MLIPRLFFSSDYARAMEIEPSNQSAIDGVRRVNELVQKKQEKEKEELVGKLKDLGNMVLKPFGIFFVGKEV